MQVMATITTDAYRTMANSPSQNSTAANPALSKVWEDPRTTALKYFPEFDVQKHVIIVTGGGRGLGLLMAETLFQAGAIVHCFDSFREPDEDFTRVLRLTERLPGGTLQYHSIDVCNSQKLQELIVTISESYNRLDGVIAAAGIQKITRALDYRKEDVDDMLETNYTAAFMTVQEAGKQMLRFKTPGTIVLVASISGQQANKGLYSPIFSSSKAALIQLSKSLAMEWGSSGIRVNALCPGHILTPVMKANLRDHPELADIWRRETMLGRFSESREFRGATIFLMSRASSFMTGSSLNIDGGETAW